MKKAEETPVESSTKDLEKKLFLRDELAMERTRLAQERTHLAYIRTGISLMLGGIFFIGYFPPGTTFYHIGYLTTAVSVLFVVYGFYKHRKTRRFIDSVIDDIIFGEDKKF